MIRKPEKWGISFLPKIAILNSYPSVSPLIHRHMDLLKRIPPQPHENPPPTPSPLPRPTPPPVLPPPFSLHCRTPTDSLHVIFEFPGLASRYPSPPKKTSDGASCPTVNPLPLLSLWPVPDHPFIRYSLFPSFRFLPPPSSSIRHYLLPFKNCSVNSLKLDGSDSKAFFFYGLCDPDRFRSITF